MRSSLFYESRVKVKEHGEDPALRRALLSERQQNEHVRHATEGSRPGMRILLRGPA